MRLWVGAYAADAGSAEGIGILQAGEADDAGAGGPLGMVGTAVAAPGSPSWIAPHPSGEILYAALESDGVVQAYRRVSDTRLAPLGAPIEAGAAVCHVAVAPDASFLVASCWGDGRVVRMDLDAAGRPSRPVIAAAATDPYDSSAEEGTLSTGARVSGAVVPDLAAAARALREAAGEEYAHLIPAYDDVPETDAESEEAVAGARVSRAHQATFLPGGLVATTDMGLDLVRIWRTVPAGCDPCKMWCSRRAAVRGTGSGIPPGTSTSSPSSAARCSCSPPTARGVGTCAPGSSCWARSRPTPLPS